MRRIKLDSIISFVISLIFHPESFPVSLDVLYGGLGILKLQFFLYQKRTIFLQL
jgi:hypothetical protein